jgi:hypothetical protein
MSLRSGKLPLLRSEDEFLDHTGSRLQFGLTRPTFGERQVRRTGIKRPESISPAIYAELSKLQVDLATDHTRQAQHARP